jgi:transketolase
MDAVEKVGNGHPGTAMSLAPLAHLLFSRFLRHDPTDPSWLGRDRFVLSCGHSSLTLYIQLYLAGYGLELSDLESFRTWGSKTPGHPEHGHTVGVETTTGPLGQGIATAVGMAMASRYERGMLDPDAPWGTSPFDHHVWVIASDGDLEEGISGEASSLAGTQRLANLTVIWDDNHISIEGDTAVAFTEDVSARYASYGWAVHEVGLTPVGEVDVEALAEALTAARLESQRPTFIAMRSVIAWPAPNAQNTEKAHGAALGATEIAATKERLGLSPDESFAVPEDVLAHTRAVAERNRPVRAAWDQVYARWRSTQPQRAELLDRLLAGTLPDAMESVLPIFQTGTSIATRSASGTTINALATVLPELWGGSADLAGSNNTTIDTGLSFLPAGTPAAHASPYGRVIHFGIREHAMGAILNGIALSGLTRPFGGTFLVFSDYMRGAVRLSALMKVPVTYVWTHDSIGLGEDGPTHQPVEHLWALRAIPGLAIVRPADARETALAWLGIIQQRGPAGLILSRQGLPVLGETENLSAADMARGAYVLADCVGNAPAAIIIATGSEVSIALAAREVLLKENIDTRVVSAPCLEWFDQQPAPYRDSVLAPECRVRVSVEAGATIGWHRYVGDAGVVIGLDHFGASADAVTLFREFGISADAVADAVRRSLAATIPE